MHKPRGKFAVEEFDGKFVVALHVSERHRRYFCRSVKSYSEALKYFWRYIGAA